jgi:hypothetical protein
MRLHLAKKLKHLVVLFTRAAELQELLVMSDVRPDDFRVFHRTAPS